MLQYKAVIEYYNTNLRSEKSIYLHMQMTIICMLNILQKITVFLIMLTIYSANLLSKPYKKEYNY